MIRIFGADADLKAQNQELTERLFCLQFITTAHLEITIDKKYWDPSVCALAQSGSIKIHTPN